MTKRVRTVPSDFDEGDVAEIDRRLKTLASDHRVAIGVAIESGSRAWGFPSPDSDYDCRFLFVRSFGDYLSPWQQRDVIEAPLEGEFDVNGWELGKALKLMLKGNAVVIEWLMSPIVYDADPLLKEELTAFAKHHCSREGIARHYLHLGERQRRTYFSDAKDIQLKKLFYALRPAAALRWLRLHPTEAVAPMHFPTLLAECDPPRDVAEISVELIRRKARTRELGSAPLPRPIELFVDGEFETARGAFLPQRAPLNPEAKVAADELFRRGVQRLGPDRRSTPTR